MKKVVLVFLLMFICFWSYSLTFYLTNGAIDIISFATNLGGDVSYDPYKSKITLSWNTNIVEFFENRDFFIVNSNFVLPLPNGLIKSNYNYYLPFSAFDAIISFFRIQCEVKNYSSVFSSNFFLPQLQDVKKEEDRKYTNYSLMKDQTSVSTNVVSNTNYVPFKFIIIDAGHGGKDPGAIHNGVKEKDLNLLFAKEIYNVLRPQLEAKGIKVVLTRNSDVYITLEDRVKMANALLKNTKGYGLFISIHQNASPIISKKGTEIYYVSDTAADDESRSVLAFENSFIPKDEIKNISELERVIGKIRSVALMEESKILSRFLENSMSSLNPLLKGAPFYVIKYIPVPSVLIEVGYISHPEEVKKLKDPSFIKNFALLVSEGILKFISDYNITQGFTVAR
ncbi:MAG: N-acetylmuramoyl-L-alanine amidase family protein [Brevinematia bacterium]